MARAYRSTSNPEANFRIVVWGLESVWVRRSVERRWAVSLECFLKRTQLEEPRTVDEVINLGGRGFGTDQSTGLAEGRASSTPARAPNSCVNELRM